MEKEIKVTKKGATKKAAELRKKIRERPIPQRIYDFVEAYKKEQRNNNLKAPSRAKSDDKSF